MTTRVIPITAAGRRHDPFAQGPGAPRPVPRPANPRLAAPLGQGSYAIPEGAVLEINHTPAREGSQAAVTLLGTGTVRLRLVDATKQTKAKP
jgi:hypothetical protein